MGPPDESEPLLSQRPREAAGDLQPCGRPQIPPLLSGQQPFSQERKASAHLVPVHDKCLVAKKDGATQLPVPELLGGQLAAISSGPERLDITSCSLGAAHSQ